MDKSILDETMLGDIILCEPITKKGRLSLARLHLSDEDVSPSFFYNKIRVESIYGANQTFKEYEDGTDDSNRNLYYQYTTDFEQFKEIQERLENFDSRFFSDLPSEYPLLMLGVAGNGKSIEVNRRIREITHGKTEFECGRAYFDLENAFTKKTYGVTYSCPNPKRSIWLFCIKLLDGIMQYIRHCHLLCPTIYYNFNNLIANNNLANEEQKTFFKNVGKFHIGNVDEETEIFKSLIGLLTSQYPDKDVETLLELLMWIMFCSEPNMKHYIVFDNIEQYIKLNTAKIQIPNRDISMIYQAVNATVTNIVNDFNDIAANQAWKSFKIIIVLRRTSIGLLDADLLHSPAKIDLNANDITGHFQVPEIWSKKRKYIWEQKLKDKFDDTNSKELIEILDVIMEDNINATGVSYQLLIAPLMSYGIRRNARAQAHAAYKTHEIISSGDTEVINVDEYKKLISEFGQKNTTVRYMFRRFLIELQFKWCISTKRWKNLGIGHLTGKKTCIYHRKKFEVEEVTYSNSNYVSLMWRILSYLSYYQDSNNDSDSEKSKSVVEIFSTISLFELMEGIFINPQKEDRSTDNGFLQLAKVLIALSDMSNADTKSAPYIILGIDNDRFHMNTCDSVLADILREIWNAGPSDSLPGKKYNSTDYGVRITNAGHSFVLDWQASFSFMSSLYCYTIPPLFSLKNILNIKYVIETVYNKSNLLCTMFESEASRFCGNGSNITLRTTGKYLLKHKGKFVTFRQRTKELHVGHLSLYRTFVENNYAILGMSEEDMLELTSEGGFIKRYINLYNNWEIKNGVKECF
ncbi:MAG: hypothetical protein J1F31_06855 [Erysipelotrichales bacterium]|nr:hypothetical protein [Erysipelotrichales bacterium]